MRRLRGTRLLVAVPIGVFALVFGASFAYHSRDSESPARAAPGVAAGGKELIAVSVRGDGVGDSYVWIVSLDGSERRRLTYPPEASVSVNDGYAAWSPGGETILIVRQVIEDPANPTNPHLYAIAPDGTGLRQLTRGQAFDLLPSWAPDGQAIVFSRVIDERATDVFTMRADGSGVVQLTDNPGVHEDMATFSPDGARIVYTRVDEKTEDLWVMNADGSGQEPLIQGPRQDGSPDFSPDGSQLAFVRDGHVAVASRDGTGVRLLTRGELGDSNPQWSPDGAKILFTRDPGEVFVMNADGSGLVRVPIEGQAGGASWGPAE
jgi:Tol biopolymer transport system component